MILHEILRHDIRETKLKSIFSSRSLLIDNECGVYQHWPEESIGYSWYVYGLILGKFCQLPGEILDKFLGSS